MLATSANEAELLVVQEEIGRKSQGVTIPDNTAAGVNIPFVVSGVGQIADLNFRIDGTSCDTMNPSLTVGVDHTFVGDLKFTLTSPASTSVVLMDRPGSGALGSSGNNFCQTLLDDDGAFQSIDSITPAQAPYTGTFNPENPLSAFDGQSADGTWTLNVSDNSGGDEGFVRAFSLIFRPLTCCAAPSGSCMITCPDPITQSNDANECSAVNYPAPQTTGSCSTVTCDPPSGSIFVKGQTIVTCTNTGGPSCSFTVTVTDTQQPTISCPDPITQSNDPNECGAVVTFPLPTATDNCPGIATPVCVPPSGSIFSKGPTTVTCTVADSSANTANCAFTVTVTDTNSLTITCPGDIIKSNDPNQCGAVVTFPLPPATDNCPGIATPVCVPPSGSIFSKGPTTVTCTVADSSGNMASCAFTVTVNDTQPPTITCPADINTVAPASCPFATTSGPIDFTVASSDNCPGATVACKDQNNQVVTSGQTFPVGTTTVTCTATDASGNTATCSFIVKIFDGCLQDDHVSSSVVLFNTQTGEYRFCCGGTVITGTGIAFVKDCNVGIQHTTPERRVLITFDGGGRAGSASLVNGGRVRCTIQDRNTRDNFCLCP